LKTLEEELAAQGSWGAVCMDAFKTTVGGLGEIFSTIPKLSKFFSSKPKSSDEAASKTYSKMEILKELLDDIDKKNEKLKTIQEQKTQSICETMSKLTEIQASKATEEDVLKLLSECIKSLAQTKERWEALVRFFDNINIWIETCTDKVKDLCTHDKFPRVMLS
jgi:hypothetical protein